MVSLLDACKPYCVKAGAGSWPCSCLLWLALLVFLSTSHVGAQTQDDARSVTPLLAADREQRCWTRPLPETVEEALAVTAYPASAPRIRKRQQASDKQHVLLISGATLKAAYAAGLLIGWAETGRRPDFFAVTAVDVSSLIAPFAFIGSAGDQAIADIFNCNATNLAAMAERAAAYLDGNVLETIAREHEAGRRLFIALSGSPARPETIWDIGRLAASRQPGVAAFLKRLFLAAMDKITFVDPRDAPAQAGEIVERNFIFRTPGSGAHFLWPHEVARLPIAGVRYHLIHNASIFPDESYDFIREQSTTSAPTSRTYNLVPAYEIVKHQLAVAVGFRFASIRLYLNLVPEGPFDMAYLKALFTHAYRQGRMGKEWRSTLPGLPARPRVH